MSLTLIGISGALILFLAVASSSLYRLLFHCFLVKNTGVNKKESPFINRFEHAKKLYLLLCLILFLCTLGIGYLGILSLWGAPLSWHELVTTINNRWGVQFGPDGAVIGLHSITLFLISLAIGLGGSLFLRTTLLTQLFSRLYVTRSTQAALSRLAHYLIIIISIIAGLYLNNLTSYMWQMLLIIGFGITIGLKDTVIDFFAGIWLLIEQSIEPGH
ncbi:MAG: mechanosensitive ion channel, partial [Candidatus Dependentiae bacterium]